MKKIESYKISTFDPNTKVHKVREIQEATELVYDKKTYTPLADVLDQNIEIGRFYRISTVFSGETPS